MIKTFLSALLIGTAVQGAMFTLPPVGGEIVFVRAAEAEEITGPDLTHLTEQDILGYIRKYAPALHVRERSMLKTLECEAHANADGTWDFTAQSDIVTKGVREDSWGGAQIHLPAHPSVSKAQAQDPDFAVRFMAEAFAADRASMWTCWRSLRASGNL